MTNVNGGKYIVKEKHLTMNLTVLIGQETGLGKNTLWCYLSPLSWDTQNKY